MARTMIVANGIGIAAPQVGLPIRLCIVDVASCLPGDEKIFACLNGRTLAPRHAPRRNPMPPEDDPLAGCLVFCNPTITERSEKMFSSGEGCLSLPGRNASVDRHWQITVEFFDLKGRKNCLVTNGLPARCCQHEIDHLDGILFTDRASANTSRQDCSIQ